MTETQITDICAAKMKKAVSSLCSVQKPRCAGWTGSRGGEGCSGKGCCGRADFIFAVCTTHSLSLPTGRRLLADALHCPSGRTRFLITCYV